MESPSGPEDMARTARIAGITPAPVSPAEVAAITAAVDALWPRPAAAVEAPERRSSWRFSGRWWSVPLPVRRDRPWR